MNNDLAIEASGLAKSYRDVAVLDGVDLNIPRGSVFALLGPNGAGKTTTVRILATLTEADAGQARVAGFDVRRDRSQVRRRISLTGQFAALDEAQTGEENLRMMGRLGRKPRASSDVKDAHTPCNAGRAQNERYEVSRDVCKGSVVFCRRLPFKD